VSCEETLVDCTSWAVECSTCVLQSTVWVVHGAFCVSFWKLIQKLEAQLLVAIMEP